MALIFILGTVFLIGAGCMLNILFTPNEKPSSEARKDLEKAFGNRRVK